MSVSKLTDKRLLAAANFVRQGAVVADVGTDHAYLPIFLVEEGRASYAYATDINPGPVERANENIIGSGLCEKIETRLTNGLMGLDGKGITDITVCGMGGELIAKILSEAPWVRQCGVRLILQPMTKAEVLRAYLVENGFSIIDEALAEQDRVYQIICAEYSGRKQERYTAIELLLGRCNIKKGGKLLLNLADVAIRALEVRITGKRSVGKDTFDEEQLLVELKKL